MTHKKNASIVSMCTEQKKSSKCIRASSWFLLIQNSWKNEWGKNLKFILRTTLTCFSHVAINMTQSWTYFNESFHYSVNENFIYITRLLSNMRIKKPSKLALLIQWCSWEFDFFISTQWDVIDLTVIPINQKFKSNVYVCSKIHLKSN